MTQSDTLVYRGNIFDIESLQKIEQNILLEAWRHTSILQPFQTQAMVDQVQDIFDKAC